MKHNNDEMQIEIPYAHIVNEFVQLFYSQFDNTLGSLHYLFAQRASITYNNVVFDNYNTLLNKLIELHMFRFAHQITRVHSQQISDCVFLINVVGMVCVNNTICSKFVDVFVIKKEYAQKYCISNYISNVE